MNIKQAKTEIKNSIVSYLTKNKYNDYIIPLEKQRPIFLMGPPGIGKTAIMEQISEEMGIGLLSYSMTHHTRQSALGLPYITHKIYDGKEYEVSEYTMSEIISSIYDLMENSNVKEGILFLDEINCVSETLSPIMLQFLQYKIFGRHKVPKGWIVVTAGNPPEYNNSVKEFDIVTWDRLKRIDVEPNYDIWKEYAYKAGIHNSIISYLDIKTNHFYSVENSVDGKEFVTARGWEDLSQMMLLYELNNIKITEDLIIQYLQNKKIAKSFATYYDLYNKYKCDYQIDKIVNGNITDEILERTKKSTIDENITVVSLLLDKINTPITNIFEREQIQTEFLQSIKEFNNSIIRPNQNVEDVFYKLIENKEKEIIQRKEAGNLSNNERGKKERVIELLKNQIPIIDSENREKSYKEMKKNFDKEQKQISKDIVDIQNMLTNVFDFCEKVYQEEQEIVILVSELTTNYYTADFINKHGCEKYFNHNKNILLYEIEEEIFNEIKLVENENK